MLSSTKRANSKRANHGRSRLFQDAAPSPGGGPGGESSISGTHFLKKEQFHFPPDSQVHGTPCFLTLAHDQFCQ